MLLIDGPSGGVYHEGPVDPWDTMPPLATAAREGTREDCGARPARRGRRLLALAAGACYFATAAAMTWPLLSEPARLGFVNMDVFGNIWALAWDVHQAGRNPLRLFDSNMFYPQTLSLAYAESLLPQALLAAPVIALGGSPLLAYNLVFILSFVLSGVGAYLLAEEVSGSSGGAFLAGMAFAFCTYRWVHVVHLQSLTLQWLPLALLSLRRLWRGGTTPAAVGLAVFSAFQVLSSGYYALLMALALAVTMGAEFFACGAPRNARRLVAALLVSGLCVLPVFVAYRTVQERHGFSRGRDEAAAWSARPASYLDPGRFVGLPHLTGLHSTIRDGEPFYPGSAVLILAAIGIVAGRGPWERTWAGVLTLSGFGLSLGPAIQVAGREWPGPFLLLRWLPGGPLLRTPSRLGVLALLGLGLLAALGWARLVAGKRLSPRFAVAVGALVALEAWPVDLAGLVRPFPRVPAGVEWLRSAPPGVVLELPWDSPGDSALYLYWSTRHWQRMVNGFGSFDPPGSIGTGLLGHRWPSAFSAARFRKMGVRYVVVHMERIGANQKARILAAELPEGVRLEADFVTERVYAIDPLGAGGER